MKIDDKLVEKNNKAQINESEVNKNNQSKKKGKQKQK